CMPWERLSHMERRNFDSKACRHWCFCSERVLERRSARLFKRLLVEVRGEAGGKMRDNRWFLGRGLSRHGSFPKHVRRRGERADQPRKSFREKPVTSVLTLALMCSRH